MSPVASGGLGVLDVVLGAGVVTAVALSLLGRSRRAQALSFLTLGVIMTLVWLRLGSVDVALAEAALGSGLLGALLIRLASAGPDTTAVRTGPDRPAITHAGRATLALVAGGLLAAVVAASVLRVEHRLPAWGQPLRESMPGTGLEHEVTAVLLSFRALDTLLESAILMLAGVAVLTLAPDGPGPRRPGPPPTALVWLVRVVAPILLVMALWLLFAGSSDSGGAFQSGAVLAALLILLRSVDLVPDLVLSRLLPPLLVGGVLVFCAAAALGPLAGDAWLAWQPAWAFGVVLTVEVALTAGIAAGLVLLYLTLDRGVVSRGVIRP